MVPTRRAARSPRGARSSSEVTRSVSAFAEVDDVFYPVSLRLAIVEDPGSPALPCPARYGSVTSIHIGQ